MDSGYIIEAYSPSLNQAIRRFELANMGLPQDARQAQMEADAFASLCNRDRKQHVVDWQGRITWQDVGIHTIPGYISHTN